MPFYTHFDHIYSLTLKVWLLFLLDISISIDSLPERNDCDCNLLFSLNAGCNEITDTGLWTSLVPSLQILTIMDCINVADETVAAVAQMLPSLKEFNLQVNLNSFLPFAPTFSVYFIFSPPTYITRCINPYGQREKGKGVKKNWTERVKSIFALMDQKIQPSLSLSFFICGLFFLPFLRSLPHRIRLHPLSSLLTAFSFYNRSAYSLLHFLFGPGFHYFHPNTDTYTHRHISHFAWWKEKSKKYSNNPIHWQIFSPCNWLFFLPSNSYTNEDT